MTLAILVCTDENYAMPLGVLARSLTNTAMDMPVTLHWLALDVPEAIIRQVIQHSAQCGLVMHVHRFTRSDLPANLYESGRITAAAYMRLFMSQSLPCDLSRVLYLDVDTLVFGSLKFLWDFDLEGHIGAAVLDTPSLNLSHLGARRPAHYFNSGVMLIDLKRWREAEIENQVRAVLQDTTLFLRFHDQDALNLVLVNTVKFLPARWNLLPTRDNWWRLKIYGWAARLGLSRRLPDAIVHFAARHKPWHYLGSHPLKGRYQRYLKHTPWKNYVPADATWRHRGYKYTPKFLRKFFWSGIAE